jgi:hypothetical protein
LVEQQQWAAIYCCSPFEFRRAALKEEKKTCWHAIDFFFFYRQKSPLREGFEYIKEVKYQTF